MTVGLKAIYTSALSKQQTVKEFSKQPLPSTAPEPGNSSYVAAGAQPWCTLKPGGLHPRLMNMTTAFLFTGSACGKATCVPQGDTHTHRGHVHSYKTPTDEALPSTAPTFNTSRSDLIGKLPSPSVAGKDCRSLVKAHVHSWIPHAPLWLLCLLSTSAQIPGPITYPMGPPLTSWSSLVLALNRHTYSHTCPTGTPHSWCPPHTIMNLLPIWPPPTRSQSLLLTGWFTCGFVSEYTGTPFAHSVSFLMAHQLVTAGLWHCLYLSLVYQFVSVCFCLSLPSLLSPFVLKRSLTG